MLPLSDIYSHLIDFSAPVYQMSPIYITRRPQKLPALTNIITVCCTQLTKVKEVLTQFHSSNYQVFDPVLWICIYGTLFLMGCFIAFIYYIYAVKLPLEGLVKPSTWIDFALVPAKCVEPDQFKWFPRHSTGAAERSIVFT